MKKFCFLFFILAYAIVLKAQPLNHRPAYDISKDRVLYTVGYAHLDSEWNWDYPATINECIKNIMTENFYLFEKYPDYVFNFTGSRRYHMMKEYYPDLYKKVGEYIGKGRWFVSGSSVDEGEVNMSSSEALIRQVLYGNNYFRKEFGVESMDYMLPDCFGFLANMPSIWNHCGLLGFSTQKLTWRSAAGVPFNVGVWYGPDGKGIVAALNATDYTGRVVPRLDLDNNWNKRLDDNYKKYGISFDFRYYGVGDQGGAPRERDVKNATGSLRHSDSKLNVVLTSSDQMFRDITPDIQKKLPTYTGDLLLIEHSAGSLTSQAYMKRINRKNELLAQSAEQLASAASWFGVSMYPQEKLNNAWELLLGSQFHDILPGTSIPKAYEYAWNDEFIAANGFASVLQHSAGAISVDLNTQTKGRAVVVYNPVAINREDVVTAELEYEKMPESIAVFGPKGEVAPSQVISKEGDKVKFIFLARVPSVGMTVYDVRESGKIQAPKTTLAVSDRTLENSFYKVVVNEKGDIASIYDKKNSRELLSKPARLEFQSEESFEWPAWNMNWSDRKKPPFDFMDKETGIRVVENGPVRVALEIKRKGQNSEITQVLSLAEGEAGKHLEITNRVDWQSRGVSLKAAFPLTVENDLATYNMGVGTIQRSTNNESKFEVPAKEWFDLTDKSSKYGVSVLEDCKYGSDKPDKNTIRLTLLYTPKTDNRYVVQNSQDWGIHQFKYGIYGHQGSWAEALTPWQGKCLNTPLQAFETEKHDGSKGKSLSLLSVSSPQVELMACKKMEQGEAYIIRVNEILGKDGKNFNISFPLNIEDAYEVNGQEKKIGEASFNGNTLKFDLGHYAIRSFAVKFSSKTQPDLPAQAIVELPCNADVFSFDQNRDDGRFDNVNSYPAELISPEIISNDIRFRIGSTEDGANNAVACKGQQISLPSGNYNKICFLAASNEDVKTNFKVDERIIPMSIQAWTGYVGQYYNRDFEKDGITVSKIFSPYTKKDNIAWFASHIHRAYPSRNEAYQYGYIYNYEIPVSPGAKTITLPDNPKIKIIAVTVARTGNGDSKPLQPLYDDLNNSSPVALRNVR